MKVSVATIFSLFIAAPALAQPVPKIEVVYKSPDGSVFDRNCAQFSRTAVKREWVEETVRRRAEFQALWDAEGPQYVRLALQEIGLPFPYGEMQAHLTVCTGSMSDPLLLSTRPFLSDTPEADRLPLWLFAFELYHELMHTYVTPVQPSSALMKKYANEAPATRLHLHVLALEKLALVRLRTDVELKFWDSEYRTGWIAKNTPSYKRAWEIVNDVEGYEAFLNELKALKAQSAVK